MRCFICMLLFVCVCVCVFVCGAEETLFEGEDETINDFDISAADRSSELDVYCNCFIVCN